jgi:fructose-bisphosphate aldolase/6-deoxy-5-ketofructose 1-phosphate synthase
MKKNNFSTDQTVPLDVPLDKRAHYLKNLHTLTKDTGRLFIFAGDQRVEHLNDDFYGENISLDDANPEHLFKIASMARIGGFATQLGNIARYGSHYPNIPYLVKLNSKTNLVPFSEQDPYSAAWYDVREVVAFAKSSKLNILGVGYTVYIGSKFETAMLHEAARIVLEAHRHGLVVILWMYPRGQAVTNPKNAHLIAGAVNVGASLGADFVKINEPEPVTDSGLKEIISAGGRTGILFAGGQARSLDEVLNSIYLHVNRFGAAGAALGRNIHQRSTTEAIALANAVAGIIYDGHAPETVRRLLIKE